MALEPNTAEKPQLPDQPKNQDRSSIFHTSAADIAGIVLTAASSVGAALLMINKNFFKNAEKEKRFDKIHAIRDAERAKPETQSLKGHDWLVRIRRIEAEHEIAIAKDLQEMGISGITAPIEKFRSLRTHQKSEVFWTVAAVTAGAIGVVSSIISNRLTAQKEKELGAKLDAIEVQTRAGQAI